MRIFRQHLLKILKTNFKYSSSLLPKYKGLNTHYKAIKKKINFQVHQFTMNKKLIQEKLFCKKKLKL